MAQAQLDYNKPAGQYVLHCSNDVTIKVSNTHSPDAVTVVLTKNRVKIALTHEEWAAIADSIQTIEMAALLLRGKLGFMPSA